MGSFSALSSFVFSFFKARQAARRATASRWIRSAQLLELKIAPTVLVPISTDAAESIAESTSDGDDASAEDSSSAIDAVF